VVLVQLLCILDAAVQRGHKVLGDANNRLDEHQDVGDEAEDGVRRDKVRAAVGDLVVLDHDQAGEGGEQGDVVESGVRVGALFLLRGCVCWLDDEDALDEEEEGGGVEERVRRKEDNIMTEDASPYDRCELCSSVSCCVLLYSSSSISMGIRTIQAPACATTPVPFFTVSLVRQGEVQ